MAKNTGETQNDPPADKKESPPESELTFEDRVSDFAISQFSALGHQGRLPDALVAVYKEYKLRVDRMAAGRLSAEGFAFVDFITDVVTGAFIVPEKA